MLFQLHKSCESIKEEYQDALKRIEFERAEYETEIDNANVEVANRDENIKVRPVGELGYRWEAVGEAASVLVAVLVKFLLTTTRND